MKKLLTILLTLLLLVGCAQKKNLVDYHKYTTTDFLGFIKNYQVREKTNNQKDNEKFNTFLDELFVDYLSRDYTTMHFTVVDYKKYGIEKPEVNLGVIDYDGMDNYEFVVDKLNTLMSFDYNKLSYSQQCDFDIIEYGLYQDVLTELFSKYSQLFTTRVNLISDIISILSDFTFYDKESVDDYMLLVKDYDRYVEDALTFTDRQMVDGVCMLDYSIDTAVEYVESFISNKEDNELISSFNERIDKLDFLNTNEKNKYKEENKKIVFDEVIPESEKVIDKLNSYKGKITDSFDGTLSQINREYAEYYFLKKTSSNVELKDMFNDLLLDFATELQEYYYNYENVCGDEYAEVLANPIYPFDLGYAELLDFLYENTKNNYPDIGEFEYSMSLLNPDTASPSVLAYYWPAPIDNKDQNIIRLNPNTLGDDLLQTYTTISHEGIPGHMYQRAYQLYAQNHPYQEMFSFIGYEEGWAVYNQTEALKWALETEELAQMIGFDNNYYFGLYTMIDLGVNYYEWTIAKLEEFLSYVGLSTSSAEGFYDFIVDMSGIYCSYGYGYYKMKQLRNKAEEELLDNYDDKYYYQAVLEKGSLPFVLLEEKVNNYISEMAN